MRSRCNKIKRRAKTTSLAFLMSVSACSTISYRRNPSSIQIGLLESCSKNLILFLKHERAHAFTELINVHPSLKSGGDFETKLRMSKFFLDRKGLNYSRFDDDELVALYDYTINGFAYLNPVLRSGDLDSIDSIRPYVYTLNSALEKLPKFRGMAYRGTNLPESALADYVVGKVITYQSYTSASKGTGFGGRHLFEIMSLDGRYVGAYSHREIEEEVIFKPGSKFIVKRIETLPSGQTLFSLEEF